MKRKKPITHSSARIPDWQELAVAPCGVATCSRHLVDLAAFDAFDVFAGERVLHGQLATAPRAIERDPGLVASPVAAIAHEGDETDGRDGECAAEQDYDKERPALRARLVAPK